MTEPAARQGAHPALVLFALAMGGFAIGTTEFATMSLLPYMAAGLHVDAPTAGHVISAYALGVVVGAPLLAVISAKLPRKTLLILFMAMFALGNGLSALAPSYGWMLTFRFVSGLPHGAYFGIAALVAASMVPDNRRTQAVSRVMLGLTVATIIGVPAANWLGQIAGWRWGFGIVTALGIITMALVAQFAPMDRPQSGYEPAARIARAAPAAGVAHAGDRCHRLRRHVRRLHLPRRHADGRHPRERQHRAAGAGGVRHRHDDRQPGRPPLRQIAR